MLIKVPTVKTPIDRASLAHALSKAWLLEYKTLPRKDQIAVIYAQWAIETGQGQFCWNWNLGNVKAADVNGQVIEYIALNGVWEIINGKRIVLSPDDPGAWFRAFRTLDSGVEHHFKLLKNRRYSIAWSEVVAGNPAGFSRKLKQQGYYTASEADYTRSLVSFFNLFMKQSWFEDGIKALKSETEKIVETISVEEIQAQEPIRIIHPKLEFARKLTEVEDKPLKLTGVEKFFSVLFQIMKAFSGLFKKQIK